jgi:aryl-alcohol dehydrogenase-like predicted oxidoreductase
MKQLEYTVISGTEMNVSRIAQGTWAIGGWMWGGTDERESIRTIHAALDKGINLIDTAPVRETEPLCHSSHSSFIRPRRF